MKSEREIRIIICDDHALFRLGVESALNAVPGMHVVGSVPSADKLLLLLRETEADLILLDIIMPGLSGIEAMPIIRRKAPDAKILILSVDSSQQAIEKALDAGVDGFISKTLPIGELAVAIDSVDRGYNYYGRDIARIIRDITEMRGNMPQVEFTTREEEIIRLCCEGLLCKEVAARLDISPRTVDTHKTNIFRKLGINNSVELVRYATREGLMKF